MARGRIRYVGCNANYYQWPAIACDSPRFVGQPAGTSAEPLRRINEASTSTSGSGAWPLPLSSPRSVRLGLLIYVFFVRRSPKLQAESVCHNVEQDPGSHEIKAQLI
jgi:hypothetical protein